MSGYLQRLASSVRSPAGAIRPLVGSLYSAPKSETMSPLVEEEIVIGLRSAPAPADAPDTNRLDTQFEEAGPSPRSYVPLIKETTNRSQTVAAEQRLSFREPQLPEERTGPPRPLGRQREQTAAAKPEQTAKPQQSLSGPVRETARSSKPDLQRRTPLPHEPDEIQIHIGRIEVTAVPPPVTRPAVAPQRKSLNLGEYLKRGRGRT